MAIQTNPDVNFGHKSIHFKGDLMTSTHKSIFQTLFNLDPLADDINRIMFEAQPCREDPLSDPKWKRWSR